MPIKYFKIVIRPKRTIVPPHFRRQNLHGVSLPDLKLKEKREIEGS
jgi:hypothetical protein